MHPLLPADVIRHLNGYPFKPSLQIVKYHNYNEEGPWFTDRSVRKLIKIFEIDEYVLQDDLTELLKRLNSHDTGNTEAPINSSSPRR